MSLEIKGFIETSLVDWDGKIVSIIFLPGCNFRCPYCQNMGLIEHPEKYKTIPESRIYTYLESHKNYIDGICISGGEPTLHKDKGLTEFIKKIKEMGFLVKLDTNGTDPEYIKDLIQHDLVDFIAMDIKASLDEQSYIKAANVKVPINSIKRTVKLLMEGRTDYEFRTTVVPKLIDMAAIESIAKSLKGAKSYCLQQFEPENCGDIELKKLKPVDEATIKKMIETARKYIGHVSYRGRSGTISTSRA